MSGPPVRLPFVDLQRQYARIQPTVDEAMRRVVASHFYILGDELRAFEEAFAAYLGVPHVSGVASGTDGLILALRALGIGPGDEVITPTQSFVATALAVTEVGATSVFVDSDPETYQMDTGAVEARITPRTKALLPVHLYGAPADMHEVLRIARAHGLRVVEDACQAHGASLDGRKLGTFGDLGVFSFYPTKNLGAYGDGGAVCTGSPELQERLRLLRNYGEREKYVHDTFGRNSRLDDLQAAVLAVKLPHLDEWNRQRNEVAAWYRAGLRGVPTQAIPEGALSSYHLFVMESRDRDGLRRHLADRGIQALVHYPVPIHRQGCYRDLGYQPGSLPVAERVMDRILSLPMFPELTRAEVDEIVEAVNAFEAGGGYDRQSSTRSSL